MPDEPTAEPTTDPAPDAPETVTADPALLDPSAAPPDATAQPAAPDFTSLIGRDGKFTPEFAAALPEELRGVAGTTNDIQSAFQRLRETQAALRTKNDGRVKIPGEDATPEEIAEYHKAIGVPETADGYGINEPDNLPEGVEWDGEFASAAAEKARELGLKPDQLQGFVELYNAHQATKATQMADARAQIEAETHAKLKEMFGDRVDDKLAKATDIAKRLGFDVSDGVLFSTPENIKNLVDNIGPRFGEAIHIDAESATDARTAAAEKLISMSTNPNDPDYAKYKDGDPAALAKFRMLEKQAPAEMVNRMLQGAAVHVGQGL